MTFHELYQSVPPSLDIERSDISTLDKHPIGKNEEIQLDSGKMRKNICCSLTDFEGPYI